MMAGVIALETRIERNHYSAWQSTIEAADLVGNNNCEYSPAEFSSIYSAIKQEDTGQYGLDLSTPELKEARSNLKSLHN